MEFTLAEQFLILAHLPDTTRLAMSADQRNKGFLGALLQDLEQHRHIALEGNKVRVLSAHTQLSRAHQQVLDIMNKTNKQRRLKNWLVRLSNHTRKLRYAAFDTLARKGALQVANKQFLFFKYKSVCLTNSQPRTQLLQGLKKAVRSSAKPTLEHEALLLVLNVCRVYKLLADDGYTKRQVKKKLMAIFADDVMYKELKKGVDELAAAAAAAT